MKVGTITFHWATNYGAVLQAYALQKYLQSIGYDTEIINYIPYKIKYRNVLSHLKNRDFNNLLKEYRISKFRKKNLVLSKPYYTNKQLFKYCNIYNVFICGSDQIWNEWFINNSESNINLTYYLNFASSNSKRISYAASLGTNKLKKSTINLVENELIKFSKIGVRENTGKLIMNDMGLDATVVLDPTLLIESSIYNEIITKPQKRKNLKMFPYILHENQETSIRVKNHILDKFFPKQQNNNLSRISIEDWLYYIKNAELVVTNSFHGVVFSIIFNTPFIVLPVEGSNMNDRINTLLGSLYLEHRILYQYDEKLIETLINEKLEWKLVNEKIKILRKKSIDFLTSAI